MVQKAELSVPDYVGMVAAGLAGEQSVASLTVLLDNCAGVLHQLADPAWAATGTGLLADQAVALLRSAAPGSDHQLAWAQLLAWSATTSEQLSLLAGLLTGTVEIDGLQAGVPLRWAMLGRLAAAGRADDGQVMAELARDGSDSGQREAAACRAAMPDPAHKAAAWALLTNTTELNADLLRSVARAFWQPDQAALLEPYTARYFEDLPQIWAAAGGHLKFALALLLFPQTAASPALLTAIDEFLAAAPRDPGLVRVLTECRDQTVRALASRAL